MPRRRVRLLAAELHYRPGVHLHTAASGSVPALHELYLVIEDDRGLLGLGGVRTNVEYLTGIPESVVRQEGQRLRDLPWAGDLDELLAVVHGQSGLSVTTRALVDTTIFDARSRREGVPLCAYLGGSFCGGYSTNQTLFWCPDESLIETAREYVARGFTDLKLRVGIGSFDGDLRRLERLRGVFGSAITLSIDANGRWSEREAEEHLERLRPFELAYVEQPIGASDWDAIARIAQRSPTPLMLDESLASLADVQHLAQQRLPVLAHLKVAKLGGVGPLVEAATVLAKAGVEVMIGQMNEGSVATAAAVQCAMALQPQRGELYGADGLLDDTARGLAYRAGMVEIADRPGLGIDFCEEHTALIWETTA